MARIRIPYPEANTWDTFISYRYQKSDRHFNGPHEQSFTDPTTGRTVEQVRIKEGSQVINYLNLFDLSARYNLSSRSSVTVSVPYVNIERSQTLTGPRDPETLLRPIRDRYSTHATGLSDITVAYRRWMLEPETHKNGNFSLGAGIKIPTGSSSVHDTFRTFDTVTNTFGTAVRPVDQSIQPGDGGFGFILDGSMFLRFGALDENRVVVLVGRDIVLPGMKKPSRTGPRWSTAGRWARRYWLRMSFGLLVASWRPLTAKDRCVPSPPS